MPASLARYPLRPAPCRPSSLRHPRAAADDASADHPFVSSLKAAPPHLLPRRRCRHARGGAPLRRAAALPQRGPLRGRRRRGHLGVAGRAPRGDGAHGSVPHERRAA
ncbi:Os12g0559100 [Oryza sativa Japonica Group]|uniref:Os12g0559100 protein n=1 Tax=Oryza sativa subsp. japonica TaxID=39947 RepID=A0A0N7KU74_ORYSJ|nr:hypothetical protein EE612_060245 [Oryza sativa]KAF2908314.1 hypothetical protein DAI22_12g175732 [Oryza sativa Japonica Group]BAT17626.1 Os12g0559100 [Oryza sativa Japonica Group]